ncbi:MAG: UvrD-helicase domain-containing protein [Acidobacteria bacterium]|nr:UvrD-helicase domain-containing protein [Acidobacteriota bacterium]
MDLAKILNPQQLEAVEATEGPVLILAGAGSGKTRVITYRVAHLIENREVRPEQVLAVTFTNKAADQMKFRVRNLLRAARSGDPLISTFHSLCVRLLRREIEALHYTRDFTIYDEADQLSVVRAASKDLKVDERLVTPKTIQSRISHAKNHGKTPQNLLDDSWEPSWEYTANVFTEYEKRLRKSNALDFDDLLIRTVELFDKFPQLAEKYSTRFPYVMVDEYQDTNRMQYRLVRHLTRAHDNVCVVGDEDQSIYSWRGADIQNILSFEKDFPSVRVIKLEQNYRSTKNILAAAGAVVAHNEMRKGKALWTQNPLGEPITYMEAGDADEEAMYVADRILYHQKADPSVRIAVLYRTNFLSRVVEEKLRRYNMKYKIVGGFSFYERAEIKDMISYLTVALNPNDSVNLLRVINAPARGIGKTTTDTLEELAVEHSTSIWRAIEIAVQEARLPMRTLRALEAFYKMVAEFVEAAGELSNSALLEKIIHATKYIEVLQEEGTEESESRIENIRELLTAADESHERGEKLRDFLDYAALVSDQDAYDERSPISLMTLHTAKGLEFPVVLIMGLEDGLFPHSRSIMEAAQLEEERRLFYVGMTRAQHKLYLAAARYRRYFGNMDQQVSEPSRFLSEIPEELIEDAGEPRRRPAVKYTGGSYNTVDAVMKVLGGGEKKSAPAFKPPAGKKSAGVWTLGTRVKHAKYGYGTVLRTEGSGDEVKLTVSFINHGLKKMIAKYAELEIA